MAVDEGRLVRRARRAYEAGRFEAALRLAAWVVPMVAVSAITGGHLRSTALTGVTLVALVTALAWRGGDEGRGVRRGLVAGLGPLLLPVAVRACGHSCTDGACLLFPTACIAGGAIAGVAVALLASTSFTARPRLLVSAFATAFLTGSLGCVLLGLGGIAGMTAGMALGASPLLWAPRPRHS
jgi:hypothetical protein